MTESLPIVSAARIADVVGNVESERLNVSLSETTKRAGLILPGNRLSQMNQASPNLTVNKALHEGLAALRQERAKPGVLVAPDHQVASLLQTFIARRGKEEGRVIESGDPSFTSREVRFDEHDWKGW